MANDACSGGMNRGNAKDRRAIRGYGLGIIFWLRVLVLQICMLVLHCPSFTDTSDAQGSLSSFPSTWIEKIKLVCFALLAFSCAWFRAWNSIESKVSETALFWHKRKLKRALFLRPTDSSQVAGTGLQCDAELDLSAVIFSVFKFPTEVTR